jgi:hypothetical protein
MFLQERQVPSRRCVPVPQSQLILVLMIVFRDWQAGSPVVNSLTANVRRPRIPNYPREFSTCPVIE